ncbi:hypothetical protein GCK32_020081 [Trichostrongylus colubriformis]|uniref:Uncharacterized protein n=1 Tax=Trichostrongylus colubriformis TaxID=6319 RepID=A0AAN8IGZ6_TRICO
MLHSHFGIFLCYHCSTYNTLMPQEVPVIKIDPPNDAKKSPDVDGVLSNSRVSFFLPEPDDNSSLKATPKSSPLV